MINLHQEQLSLLQSLIKTSLVYYGTSKLHIYPTAASAIDRKIFFVFEKAKNFTNVLFCCDFFESQNDWTFYDYQFEEIEFLDDSSLNAQVYLQTSPIQEILVFGRDFNINDFTDPSVRQKYNQIIKTDELFYFRCEQEEFLLCVDPYMPNVSIIVLAKEIQNFFRENDCYAQTHRIF